MQVPDEQFLRGCARALLAQTENQAEGGRRRASPKNHRLQRLTCGTAWRTSSRRSNCWKVRRPPTHALASLSTPPQGLLAAPEGLRYSTGLSAGSIGARAVLGTLRCPDSSQARANGTLGPSMTGVTGECGPDDCTCCRLCGPGHNDRTANVPRRELQKQQAIDGAGGGGGGSGRTQNFLLTPEHKPSSPGGIESQLGQQQRVPYSHTRWHSANFALLLLGTVLEEARGGPTRHRTACWYCTSCCAGAALQAAA